MAELGGDRLLAIAAEVTPAVVRLAPDAGVFVESHPNGYICASWRIDGRASRELFIEHPGTKIAAGRLRVGVYFVDAPAVTSTRFAIDFTLRALRGSRETFAALGIWPVFTESSTTRDDRYLGWSDEQTIEWLTAPSAHRDLVRVFSLDNGEPAVVDIQTTLEALAPFWLAINELE